MEIKLSEEQTIELLKCPEMGMGYQKVDVVLSSEVIIKGALILNAEICIVPDKYKDFKFEKLILHK
ncbi:MAG: hypothetical protein E2O29_01800 [Deltaproteobacteria bacterium]|nr:MAG: hypothetical protein E2O29_01800 [Deltaproteobacteria bacterium]